MHTPLGHTGTVMAAQNSNTERKAIWLGTRVKRISVIQSWRLMWEANLNIQMKRLRVFTYYNNSNRSILQWCRCIMFGLAFSSLLSMIKWKTYFSHVCCEENEAIRPLKLFEQEWNNITTSCKHELPSLKERRPKGRAQHLMVQTLGRSSWTGDLVELGSDREDSFLLLPMDSILNWCGGGVSRSHGLFLSHRYILELATCSSACLATPQTADHT